MATVHPHVHGERLARGHALTSSGGSSPRTWGTRVTTISCSSRVRFIPTYMGNAGIMSDPNRPSTVHPHVHGERTTPGTYTWEVPGSSPRTWGTRCVGIVGVYRHRFIPTYMGNAAEGGRDQDLGPVHPHVHGERSTHLDVDVPPGGSSPRTWGTLRRTCCSQTRSPVHPHVHGERPDSRIIVVFSSGSSPRTWGTPWLYLLMVTCIRFIPTYMGNALSSEILRTSCSVHPHVHGERICNP